MPEGLESTPMAPSVGSTSHQNSFKIGLFLEYSSHFLKNSPDPHLFLDLLRTVLPSGISVMSKPSPHPAPCIVMYACVR